MAFKTKANVMLVNALHSTCISKMNIRGIKFGTFLTPPSSPWMLMKFISQFTHISSLKLRLCYMWFSHKYFIYVNFIN